MAEGGNFPSMRNGSDAYFEFVCTPCGEERREEAVKYCPECQEYLCVTCTRQHGRQKVLRSHQLMNPNVAKQGSVFVKTTKCRYHDDRVIEMFCGSHDMVYCAKCIATEHRSCSGVESIEDVNASYAQDDELQNIQEDVTQVQERLIAADKKKQKNLKSIEEKRNAVEEQIQDTERNLIEHIHKLKSGTTDALNKSYNRLELKSDINGLDGAMKEVEKSKNQLDTVTNINAGQQFVQMKLIQKSVTDAKKLLEDDESKGEKSLYYTENNDTTAFLDTPTSFGEVRIINEKQYVPKQYRVKSKRETNVKMPGDQCECYITDVCQLQDGTVILADWSNKKIKRLDKDYNVRDHCDLGSSPNGICCTGQSEVAVKMNNNKIQLISVGTSLAKQRDFSVEAGVYWGLTCLDGELWLSVAERVDVYSRSGTKLKSIGITADGNKIFKGATQHMAVSGETVIVTDSSDGAVCLRTNGTVKQEFRDGRLCGTTAACISNDGTVFLSGWASKIVLMFSLDGRCLGEFASKEDGLVEPFAMCYDNKRNSLIVTSSSDTISIFMCD